MWVPQLEPAAGPKYLALADAISAAIHAQVLAPGARLPPQRELARQLGVTVGTVTRGYGEARRRGLLSGEVGRGTFVRGAARDGAPPGGALFGPELEDLASRGSAVNLAHNAPHCDDAADLLSPALRRLARRLEHHGALGYQAHTGGPRHRAAGAAWLRAARLPAAPEEIVVTSGAQQAMLVALAALTEPGDLVLTESLAYPGIKAVARLLRLRLEGVALDAHGLRVDAFAEVCRRGRPAALYCSPTIQNPTATVLPLERRQAIAELADAHGVVLVEDDTYGFLAADAPAPLASFSANAFYLTSLSKSVAPALRIGFLRAPPGRLEGPASALMATTIMASPLTAELAAELIESGAAEAIAERRRREAAGRQATARRILGRHVPADARRDSSHLWLPLPDPWRAEEFAARARGRGVLVAPAEVFAVGRGAAPHAVRVSLGAPPREGDLERGLAVLAQLLDEPPSPAFAGV